MMRSVSLLLSVAAAFSAASAQDTPPVAPPATDAAGNPCWNSFDDIRAVEFANTTDYSIHREYVLCPDTIFGMGFINEEREENGGELFIGGQYPIITQPNSSFLCGVDGKSSNNCRMRGGDAHLLVLRVNSFGIPNVTVSGITFDSAFRFSLLLDRPGDVTFNDCIFENNQNIGMIIGQVRDADERRLTAANDDVLELPDHVQASIDYIRVEFESDHHGYRFLQADEGNTTDSNTTDTNTTDTNTTDTNTTEPEPEPEPEPEEPIEPLYTFTGSFDRCVFRNNAHGEARPGVFTIINPRMILILNECTFENNDFLNNEYEFGFAVYTPGFVNATNNCFLQNNFPLTTFFLFEPLSKQAYTFNNYFETDTPSDCQLYEVPQVEGQNATCSDMRNNTDVCPIIPDTLAPTPGPTASPTSSPTMAPVAESTSGAVSVFGFAAFVATSAVMAIVSFM